VEDSPGSCWSYEEGTEGDKRLGVDGVLERKWMEPVASARSKKSSRWGPRPGGLDRWGKSREVEDSPGPVGVIIEEG